MKAHLSKTHYEVRTKGDGEFDWFSVPAQADQEERYNPDNPASAKAYAKEIGGFVVKITERTMEPFPV